MIKMTDLIRGLLNTALADGTPCLLGTASKDGHPQISPKGSIVVFNDDTLCYWERANRSAMKHVGENPHVAIYYRNAAKAKDLPWRAGCLRFYGEVRALPAGPGRDRVWEMIPEAERKPDPEKKGTAMLVSIDRVEDILGNVVMRRD